MMAAEEEEAEEEERVEEWGEEVVSRVGILELFADSWEEMVGSGRRRGLETGENEVERERRLFLSRF